MAEKNIGDTVVLTGWVAKARNLGSLIFVDLRDRTGIVQLVFDSTVDEDVFNKAEKIRNEYVLCVKGVVRPREKEAINTKMATGMVEVYVNDLRILSEAETPPIHVDDKAVTGEVNRLKYRYLDLRKPSIQKNLILRHEVARYARNFFADNGFLEIETPMLSKSTPEGARDYLVPSRIHHGKFYALPQSPQLYKQLLMVAGFDRYIQIVKCFRDEDLRADRQPEFTQIDLEMSFVDMDDVVSINEEFLKGLFKKVMDVDVEIPFRRMSYKEAMDKYGTDKPDTRFGMELKDISSFAENCSFGIFKDTVKNGGCVKLISASGAGSFSRKEIDKLVEFVKFHGGKGMAWIINGENETRSSLGKVLTEEEIKEIIRLAESNVGDLICIVSDKADVVNTALGALRCHIAEKLDIIPDNFEFLWVTDFPLFEYSEEEDRYVAKHHPFTMPVDEDIDMLETKPERVRAKAYDIVLNGYEIGGGSIRIYDNELQKRMFKALGFSEEEAYERFGFLLDAFRYGTPPHGGMAYGLDRLVMIMANCDNIRDVIAFPKVQNASCLMTGAPGMVEEKQLKELNIKIEEE
ncbi:MAG TPA: aspartate--tRNA ligase [Clostridia bacterium]|nr:aspartate--tRNA ligase [Clostridia bacterium]